MNNLLLCVTGSVASIKTRKLADLLSEKYNVRIVYSKNAEFFLKNQDLSEYEVYSDKDEWNENYKIGDPILHIELRDWADILLIAPLSANTMAKITYGLCDNLITNIVRAWSKYKRKIIAPAMNTSMWKNSITQIQIENLYDWEIILPIEKELACGEFGIGAMEEIEKIVDFILNDNVKNIVKVV